MKILAGSITAMFAFDVGFEIALENLAGVIAGESTQLITGRKRTPAYLQYARPPRIVTLPAGPELWGARAVVQATIFDFGAVSISYRWPIPPETGTTIDDLPARTAHLAGLGLDEEARDRLAALVEQIRPVVTRPEISPLVEDYYLVVLERLERQTSAVELLADHGQTLAQMLRFETKRLSREHVEEALSTRISYYEDDLVVIDWNAALICDAAYDDTASVLELMNVELLEARYVDGQLDRRIERFAEQMQRQAPWPLPLRTPYVGTLRDLSELRIESSVLAERVGNALKLIGDLYLARVHNAAVQRFYLREWEGTVKEKLGLIDEFYEILVDRVRTAQSQALELIVILLIFVEIVLGLIRW